MSKLKKFRKSPYLFFKDSLKNKLIFFNILKNKFNSKNIIFVIGFSTWKTYLRKYFYKNNLVFIDKNVDESEFNQKYKKKFLKFKKTAKVFIWGYKAPEYLLNFLQKNNFNLKFVEDGFIRSINLGATKTPPMSLCIDSLGPYFDSRKTTELEDLLQKYDFSDNEDLLEKAKQGIKLLVETGISKYNSSKWADMNTIYGPKDKRRILVLGQVENDASIEFGMRSIISNYDLVKKAKEENPDAQIIYKPHPDVLHGHRPKKSSDDSLLNICLVIGDVPLANAFETIDHVYTKTSLGGMEALIYGIKVTVFGCPFYSGWGLTDDRENCERRDRQLSIEELFAITYLVYPNYYDPNTGKKRNFFETVLDITNTIGKPQKVSETHLDNLNSSLGYDEALSYLHSKISEEESYELLLKEANIYFEIQDYEKALSIYEKALQITETSDLALSKAQCLQKLGKFTPELEESFKVAIKLANPEKKNTVAYSYFSYMWEAYPLNERFLKEFINYLNKIPSAQKVFKSFGKLQLLLAAMLAEIGEINGATKYRREAKKLQAVEKNLMFLRYRMRQRGEKNAINDYHFDLFGKLLSYKGTFKKLVLDAHGDVCIVGNGPSILGKKLGEEIDNHKIVVRFNSYNTEYPYSEDYGCKTDVWVRMPFHPYVKNAPEEGHKLIMFSGSNRYHRPYTEWESLLELIDMGFPVELFDAKAFYELQGELGSPPTAGLMLCFLLYKIIGPLKPSNFYGFSYLDEVNNTYHYSDKNAATSKRHTWSSEADFFKTLIAKDSSPFESRVLKVKSISNDSNLSSLRSKDFKNDKEYDLVISTSPGLLEYKISNQLPTYVSSSTAENHLLFIKSDGEEGKECTDLSNLENKEILVLGFGKGKTGLIAEKLAHNLNFDFKLVEYGLISSMSLPSEKQFNFSIVLDDEGIFYDTTSPSQIERILYDDLQLFTSESFERAHWLINKIKSHNITKYNNSGNIALNSKNLEKHSILVVDQTANDKSILLGQCEEFSFEDMLKSALEKSNSEVYLKLHPETLAGAKGGNLTTIDKFKNNPNLNIIDEQCNIISLIKQVDEVFVMTSGVGLEALIVGKPVTCYGFPFYAGWGLTNDKVTTNNKRKNLTLEALVYATFISYSRYYNPDTLEPCEIEEVIKWIIKNKPYYPNINF